MAKKIFLRDENNVKVLPITRGELVLDSSGNPAFHSNEFLATESQPGLMSAEDKKRIDDLENTGPGADNKVAQVNTTTSDVYRLLFSETATDETKTEGARKSAKLTFNPSTGVLQTTALIGNLDGTYVNKLTGYNKATSIAAIEAVDSLLTALGKLEFKADVAYNLINGAYDGDGTIENLAEILKVLEGISDTETIQAIVGKYLPLSGGTLTGALIISDGADRKIVLDNTDAETNWNLISFRQNGVEYGYLGTVGDTNLKWNSNTLIHSGNIGSYAFIPRDAISSNTDANNLQNGVYLNGTGNGTGNSNFPQTYSIISHFTQSDRYQSQISIGNPNVYVRRKIDTWSEWVELITNKNIGSQSVNYATSAGYADSAGYSDRLGKTWTEDINYTYGSGSNLKIISNSTGTAGNFASGWQSGISVISDYVGWQLTSYGGGEQNPYFRSLQDNGVWKPWQKLAFISDIPTSLPANGGNADTVDNLHASDLFRAYGTLGTGNSYDSDWGQSVVTFDPVVNGTYPESNPNVTILNLGNDYARRKQLAFNYNNNNIYFRRRLDSSWQPWVRLALASEIPSVTNYYWADQLITNSAKSNATPTFGNVNIKSGTNAGLAIYTSGDYSRIRFYNPTNDNNATIHYFATAYGGSSRPYVKDSLNLGCSGFVTLGAWNNPTIVVSGNTTTSNSDGKVGIGTTNPLTKLHLVGNFTTSGDIYYTGSLATNRMIRFLNNTADAYGNGIEIGGGGLTVVGGGEAASLVSASVAAEIENLVLCADEVIEFYSNCQSNLASASKMTFDKAGNLSVPGHIHINASKSLIQSQASTSHYTAAINWYKGGSSQATYDPQIGQHNTGGEKGTGSICILPYATESSPWGGGVGLFISKTQLLFEYNTVLHSGNYSSILDNRYYTETEADGRFYPLAGNVNMSGDNKWIGSTMGGGTDYWRIGGYGSSDNGICKITIGDNSNDKFQIEIADYSGTTYIPLEVVNTGINITGTATMTRGVVGGYNNTSYSLSTESFICNSWIRTKGSTGWYNEDYGGGWYMTDSTYVRVYNDKRVYNNNTSQYAFYTAGGMTASGNIYAARFVATAANSYQSNGGIILSNADIWGLNAIYTADLADVASEGYQFKRTNGNYDSIWCKDGTFYFSPNGHPDSGYGTNYTVTHSGNIYNYALPYNGWWSSDSGQNVDNANGMTFVYGNHGSPNGWGILCTFDYQYNSSYKFQLFAEGYSAAGMYYRCRSSDRGGWTDWKTVIDSGNIRSQSVNYANSAGSVAWGNITGKPSTFTPSTHYHNYFPENTAVYFRDPNNASWRGGMYWGSAGNEALCFTVVNSNTSIRFFIGSDLANWASTTWSNTPKLNIHSSGITVDGSASATAFYESSDERLKNFIRDVEVDLDKIRELPKKYFVWKKDASTFHIGTSAQAIQKLYPELVSSNTDGYLSVDYAKLSIIALKAIDLIYDTITDLKHENALLKERVSKLEQMLIK